MTRRFVLGSRCICAAVGRGGRRPNRPRIPIVLDVSDATDDATGDDDVLRRHWAVVCADRRGAARTVSGRRAATGAAPTTSRATPTSATSRGRSRSGIKDRAEIFGSFLVDTRIDRDVRPLFIDRPDVGGFVDRYPRVNQDWTGDNVGDLYVGAKVNLLVGVPAEAGGARGARHRQAADRRQRRRASSTGKADFAVDFIGSKEAGAAVELSGYARLRVPRRAGRLRHAGGAFRWGAGVGFPVAQPAAA